MTMRCCLSAVFATSFALSLAISQANGAFLKNGVLNFARGETEDSAQSNTYVKVVKRIDGSMQVFYYDPDAGNRFVQKTVPAGQSLKISYWNSSGQKIKQEIRTTGDAAAPEVSSSAKPQKMAAANSQPSAAAYDSIKDSSSKASSSGTDSTSGTASPGSAADSSSGVGASATATSNTTTDSSSNIGSSAAAGSNAAADSTSNVGSSASATSSAATDSASNIGSSAAAGSNTAADSASNVGSSAPTTSNAATDSASNVGSSASPTSNAATDSASNVGASASTTSNAGTDSASNIGSSASPTSNAATDSASNIGSSASATSNAATDSTSNIGSSASPPSADPITAPASNDGAASAGIGSATTNPPSIAGSADSNQASNSSTDANAPVLSSSAEIQPKKNDDSDPFSDDAPAASSATPNVASSAIPKFDPFALVPTMTNKPESSATSAPTGTTKATITPVATSGDSFISATNTNLGPCVWKTFPVKVYMDPAPGATGKQLESEVKEAFDTWTSVTGNKIRFQFTPKDSANIVITWTPTTSGFRDPSEAGESSVDYSTPTGPKRTLDNPGDITRAKIKLSTTDIFHKDWLPGQFKLLVLHEIGHSLGIFGHSTNSSDIMYTQKGAPELSQRDINTVNILYKSVSGN